MVKEPTATLSGAGPTDAALVIAARAGESWAQEALFQRYARMVIGMAQRLLVDPNDADDLVQDAFLNALKRLDTLENPQAFASWIGSIVVRTASKRLRKRRLLTRLGFYRAAPIDLDAVIAPNAPQDIAAELRELYGIIDQLPAEERLALLLRRVEGMEIADIARVMAVSVATVKRRLKAAEVRLLQERSKP